MRYEEFIRSVAERGHLELPTAERAAEATLRVLAERLRRKEAHDLASQLPRELQPPLQDDALEREIFPAEEFVRRVAEREEIPLTDAQVHAQAVLMTICKAVSRGELEDVLAQLSADYLDLFAPDGSLAVPDPRIDAYISFGLTADELEERFSEELARQTGIDGAEIGAIARVLTQVIEEDHERMRSQLERAGVRLHRRAA
jgi:uncharacterized protein (DUF2267 family)